MFNNARDSKKVRVLNGKYTATSFKASTTVTRSVLNEYYKVRSTKPPDQIPKPEA